MLWYWLQTLYRQSHHCLVVVTLVAFPSVWNTFRWSWTLKIKVSCKLPCGKIGKCLCLPSALGGGLWPTLCSGRYTPEKAEWVSRPIWTGVEYSTCLVPAGIWTPNRPVRSKSPHQLRLSLLTTKKHPACWKPSWSRRHSRRFAEVKFFESDEKSYCAKPVADHLQATQRVCVFCRS